MSDVSDPSNPAHTKSASLLEYAQFLISVLFLLILIFLGYSSKENQYNVMFLTLLSLACGTFFVFLPVSAELDLGWLKATGGAAIFGAIMWVTVPNAQTHNEKHDELAQQKTEIEIKLSQAESSVKSLNSQNEKLIKDVADASQKLNSVKSDYGKTLDAQTSGDAACKAQSANLRSYIVDVSTKSKDIKAALANAAQFAEAAHGNSSDAGTCSLRGKQAVDSIKTANESIILLDQTVAAALATAQ